MAFHPLRTLVKAVAFALMSCALTFFATEFLSIVGVAIYAAFTHAKVDFSITYRYIAAPTALLALVTAFIATLILDFRRAAQSR